MRKGIALSLLLLCSCATQTRVQVATGAPPDPKTLMPSLETRIFQLVDAERRKLAPDSPPLALDPELTGVAREKSGDMAARSYMAHASPGGSTTATSLMHKDADFEGVLGENLAAQPYLAQYGVQVEAIARRIVQIWLRSPSHRDNLADSAYSRTGIGAAANGHTVYVTELFAGKLASTGKPYAKPLLPGLLP